MSSAMMLHHQGFDIELGEDRVPRVLDIDLAKRLEYSRPADIRELIKRHENIIGLTVRTVRRVRGQVATEHWLTERQAIYIIGKSDTAKANEIHMAIVDAFIACRDELQIISARDQSIFKRLVNAFLLPAPTGPWDRMFSSSLVKAICALHKEPYEGGPHPRHLASTNRKIYDMVFSAPIGREIKTRNPLPKFGENHHQTLTPEAREYFATQLKIVEAIARQSETKADFWDRMEREYQGGLLQMNLPEAS